MKVFAACAWCLGGLVAGLAIGSRFLGAPAVDSQAFQGKSASAPTDDGVSAEVRGSKSVSAPTSAELAREVERWKREAENLQKTAGEVHRLRNEVSSLNGLVAELRRKQEATGTAARAEAKESEAGNSLKNVSESRSMTIAEAPAQIQAAVAREFGTAEIKGMAAHSVNGEMRYGMKGMLEDGRYFALNLGEDGRVLEKHQQIALDTLPAEVAAAVQQSFGEAKIADASHVVDGDRQYYQVTAKSAGEGIEMRVRPDGTILNYSAHFNRGDEKVTVKKK